ncbi:rab-like protein 3 isoform X2 [Microplitis demolitor]|uniref:rab-like protein 3 isoform X2 n=1 Tax=Microplitis demolitor TaxID=69319 RepID=UPI0004CD1F70|nr:rab-like protein 3 isoform X2 [Microplitis demolitor]
MAAIDKVKIIVVGDSGVGKTSLSHLICEQKPIRNPSWTVGCTVEVKLHEYKEGTPNQKTYFIELWDIGGSQSHQNTRHVFYNPTHGIILVHDLSNRKSQQNLQKWLQEVLSKEGNGSGVGRHKSFDDFDPEKFVPILVVGTKSDLIESKSNLHRRSSTIAEECGADEIFVDCLQVRSLAAGTTSSVKLSRFFDKVIERRYYLNRDINSPEKRRLQAYTSSYPQKTYHND